MQREQQQQQQQHNNPSALRTTDYKIYKSILWHVVKWFHYRMKNKSREWIGVTILFMCACVLVCLHLYSLSILFLGISMAAFIFGWIVHRNSQLNFWRTFRNQRFVKRNSLKYFRVFICSLCVYVYVYLFHNSTDSTAMRYALQFRMHLFARWNAQIVFFCLMFVYSMPKTLRSNEQHLCYDFTDKLCVLRSHFSLPSYFWFHHVFPLADKRLDDTNVHEALNLHYIQSTVHT